MPRSYDDTASRRLRHRPANEGIALDWQDDLSLITGEPFSMRGVLLRIHPADAAGAVASWVHGIRTGVLEVEYRIRDYSGEYVEVRARIYRMGQDWMGAVRRVVCVDRQWWMPGTRHFNRN